MSISRTRWVPPALLVALLAGAGLGVQSQEPQRPATAEKAEPAPLRLVLNVPAFRLDVYERGELTRSYPVSVGQPDHQTPRGNFEISRVIWNPWWHPPDSRWAAGKEPQPPGPDNPMGRAKLYFTGLYFIHGSPHESSRLHPLSHGCVRMSNEDIIELARLVHSYASPSLEPGLLERLIERPKQTKTIWLEQPVPLRVEYDVVEVLGSQIQIHPDIYSLEGTTIRELVVRALAGAGYDADAVDERHVATLVRSSQRGGHTVSVPMGLLIGKSGRAVAHRSGGERRPSPAAASASATGDRPGEEAWRAY